MKKTISIRMVHVLAVILFAGAALVDSEHCPPADNIFPCVCHGDLGIKDVVCRNMTTVDYLRQTLEGSNFTEPIPKLVITKLQSSMLTSDALGDIKVVELEIVDGNIPHIAKHAFTGQPLLSLRLDRIRLEDVPTEALDFLRRKLTTLSMSGNFLIKLEDRSLSHLDRVRSLTLSWNQISKIASISLPPNVNFLWMTGNQLMTLNRCLHHTKHLKRLDVSSNGLTSIKGEFEGISGLIWLKLDFNRISDISDSFSNLTSLEELKLVGNGIREIGEALANLSNLVYLDLAKNAITNLNRTMFENLINLYELNLSENPLTIYQICPSLIPMITLNRIKLNNSNMSTIPPDCFQNNTELGSFHLSRNELSALDLTYVTNLVYLDITFNNFRSLKNLVLPEDSFAKLVLEDNQWLCSRETTSMLNKLYWKGYRFPDGYPPCLSISEKPQTCLLYNYGYVFP